MLGFNTCRRLGGGGMVLFFSRMQVLLELLLLSALSPRLVVGKIEAEQQ
ncbi:unnamed protein product, partial [Allacma fusca]